MFIPLRVQKYVRISSEIYKFKQKTIFGTTLLSFLESIDPKKLASFNVTQIKYP